MCFQIDLQKDDAARHDFHGAFLVKLYINNLENIYEFMTQLTPACGMMNAAEWRRSERSTQTFYQAVSRSASIYREDPRLHYTSHAAPLHLH